MSRDFRIESINVSPLFPISASPCVYESEPLHVANTKARQEAQVLDILRAERCDLVVLARYMQVLPAWLCDAYPGRIINIHHSFLPSFSGARPYHQAYDRGVKLIGATCHYVSAELDAGPIIEQDAVRVDHGDSVEDFVRYGKDIEKAVLARGYATTWKIE